MQYILRILLNIIYIFYYYYYRILIIFSKYIQINKENKIEFSNIKNETKQKNENIIEKLQFEDNEIILNKENSV